MIFSGVGEGRHSKSPKDFATSTQSQSYRQGKAKVHQSALQPKSIERCKGPKPLRARRRKRLPSVGARQSKNRGAGRGSPGCPELDPPRPRAISPFRATNWAARLWPNLCVGHFINTHYLRGGSVAEKTPGAPATQFGFFALGRQSAFSLLHASRLPWRRKAHRVPFTF